MITQRDADLLEDRFKVVFVTKEELQETKSSLANTLDSILKEILAFRDEFRVLVRKITNHEDRISKLEKQIRV